MYKHPIPSLPRHVSLSQTSCCCRNQWIQFWLKTVKWQAFVTTPAVIFILNSSNLNANTIFSFLRWVFYFDAEEDYHITLATVMVWIPSETPSRFCRSLHDRNLCWIDLDEESTAIRFEETPNTLESCSGYLFNPRNIQMWDWTVSHPVDQRIHGIDLYAGHW